ncbi:MAG: DUF1834 family protein [Nitrospirae bacterium]|nr:DUF1834 family protein [Nitrospirota bacterium]
MTTEDIEDKIITEIKTQMTYVKTVETYAGQLEGEIDKLPIIYPANYVSYVVSDFEWIDGPNWKETCQFSVLVCSKNLKGNEALRKANYGCYQMIEDLKTNLINETFSLAIEKLQIVRVQLLFITKTVAVYGVDFQTSFDMTFNW